MNRLSALTVSQSMALIFALGFSATLLFAASSISRDIAAVRALSHDSDLLDATRDMGTVIQELQRERTLTYAAALRGRTAEDGAVEAQRIQTDDVLSRLATRPSLGEASRDMGPPPPALRDVADWLVDHRRSVDAGAIDAVSYREGMTAELRSLTDRTMGGIEGTKSRRFAMLVRDIGLLMSITDTVALESAMVAGIIAGLAEGTTAPAGAHDELMRQGIVRSAMLQRYGRIGDGDIQLLLGLWQRSVVTARFEQARATLINGPLDDQSLKNLVNWPEVADPMLDALRRIESVALVKAEEILDAERQALLVHIKTDLLILCGLFLTFGGLAYLTVHRVDQSIRNLIGSICRLSVDASTARVPPCPQKDLNQISNALKILRAAQIERRRNLEAAELIRTSVDERLDDILTAAANGVLDRRIDVLGMDAHGAVLARGINRLLDQIEREKATSA